MSVQSLFKFTPLFLIFIFQSCVVTENQLKIDGKKALPSSSSSVIKGTVSFLSNTLGLSSAHAAVPEVCDSQKSSGSQLYAELRGIAVDGTKTLICDVDLVNSGYEFNIIDSNFQKLYPAVQIDIVDTRADATLANRRIIASSEEKTLDIDPDISLSSHAIDAAALGQIFNGGEFETIRTQLNQKKTQFAPDRLAVVLPDIFQGVESSGDKLKNLVNFMEHNSVNNSFLSSIGTQLTQATPSQVSMPDGIDMCEINFKSSSECFKGILSPSSACFTDDYAMNYMTYDMALQDDPSATITPVTTTNSCSGSVLKKIAELHVKQDKYYSGKCSTDIQSAQSSCDNLPTMSSTSCQWEAEFYCYVHGNFISNNSNSQCSSFDASICASVPSHPLCAPVSEGGCVN